MRPCVPVLGGALLISAPPAPPPPNTSRGHHVTQSQAINAIIVYHLSDRVTCYTYHYNTLTFQMS